MTFFDDNEHPNATRTFPCLKYLRRTRSMAVLLAPTIHLFEQIICANRWCRADHTSVLHNGDLCRNSLRRSLKCVHDKSTNCVLSQYKHGLNILHHYFPQFEPDDQSADQPPPTVEVAATTAPRGQPGSRSASSSLRHRHGTNHKERSSSCFALLLSNVSHNHTFKVTMQSIESLLATSTSTVRNHACSHETVPQDSIHLNVDSNHHPTHQQSDQLSRQSDEDILQERTTIRLEESFCLSVSDTKYGNDDNQVGNHFMQSN